MLETLHDSLRQPFAKISHQDDHIKQAFRETVDHLCDQWIDAIKHGRRAMRDLAEDCDSAVTQRPRQTLAGAVVVGLMLGATVGWAIGRRS